jgi:serine/threonine protein kinase
MGVVYLAERAFEKQVAIKIVRPGAATTSLMQRFFEEWPLATLDHPNIARLLDGGTTEEPCPHRWSTSPAFLDEYREAKSLPLESRLALFRQVRAAVNAHQHLSFTMISRRATSQTAEGSPKPWISGSPSCSSRHCTRRRDANRLPRPHARGGESGAAAR